MTATRPISRTKARKARRLRKALALGFVMALPVQAMAEPVVLNALGMPGSLGLPAARPPEDGTLAFSLFRDDTRQTGTLTFQAIPRLTVSFRYGRFERVPVNLYDRSFDVQYQVLTEGDWLPGVAVGLRDFIGTGTLASEYVVATKSVSPQLSLSGGIGWGRLGAKGDLGSPFGARPGFTGLGGEPGYDQWFRGPAALFGTLDWQASDRLRFSVGWSGEDPDGPTQAGVVVAGVSWQARPGLSVSATADQGGNVALGAQFFFNPRTAPSTFTKGPQPLSFGTAAPLLAGGEPVDRLSRRLAEDGLILRAIRIDGGKAEVRVDNRRFGQAAQALGRTARALTGELGPEVTSYSVEISGPGPAASRVTLTRAELLALQDDPARAEKGWSAAQVGAVQPWHDAWLPEPAPYDFALHPYMAVSMFDPVNPLRADVGAQLDGRLRLAPNLFIDGSLRARIAGNRSDTDRFSNSKLPPVRSDAARYAIEGQAGINRLTLTYLASPVPNIYTRLSAGMLEEMYSGVVGEVLWKPPASRLGLGVELAQVWQRDPGMGLGLGYYDYSVLTGHASIYYALTPDIDARLDVGRYLAGDKGATLAVERRFANGWKVGAYATLTDVPFDTFGEGSFDKGITLTIPLEWVTGKPSTRRTNLLIQPIQRDGGARIEPGGRLYDAIRPAQAADLERSWGMFWK